MKTIIAFLLLNASIGRAVELNPSTSGIPLSPTTVTASGCIQTGATGNKLKANCSTTQDVVIGTGGSLNTGQSIVAGTMTVLGNAFSVGGAKIIGDSATSFSLSGTSITIANPGSLANIRIAASGNPTIRFRYNNSDSGGLLYNATYAGMVLTGAQFGPSIVIPDANNNIWYGPGTAFASTYTYNTGTLGLGGGLTTVGSVGIGTTSPATKLHMSSGTLTIDGTGAHIVTTGDITQTGAVNCSLGVITTATGTFTGCVASDRKLKTAIHSLDAFTGIELDALRPVSYRWKDKNRDGQEHYGFIAQDVEGVIPAAVVGAGAGLKGVDSNAIIAVMVKELQSLRKRVDQLEHHK